MLSGLERLTEIFWLRPVMATAVTPVRSGRSDFEVEEGAVERMVQRLLGDGEDLALG